MDNPEKPTGNRAERYFSKWMDEQEDFLWVYVVQPGFMASAFLESADTGSRNYERLMFGSEKFEQENYIPTDEEIQQMADAYDPELDPWNAVSEDWIGNAIVDSNERLILRPDFACFSTNLDQPGTCFVDVKRRWRTGDNTVALTVHEVQGLRDLQQLTSAPVWIAVLEYVPDRFDFEQGGYLLPVDELPYFKGIPDKVFEKKAWRYNLADISAKHRFRLKNERFDSSVLFTRGARGPDI